MCNYSLIQVYLDTSAILRYSQINDTTKPKRILIRSLYELANDDKIQIFSAQGSFSDIFGEDDEKIGTDTSIIASADREKTRTSITFPLATDYVESKNDFDENSIALFNILFNKCVKEENVFENYMELNVNDKNDFLIFRDCLNDANNSSYFITGNPNDFITNGKREKLEKFASDIGKALKIREITAETLKEIEEQIT